MVEFHGRAITIACTDQERSERFYEGKVDYAWQKEQLAREDGDSR